MKKVVLKEKETVRQAGKLGDEGILKNLEVLSMNLQELEKQLAEFGSMLVPIICPNKHMEKDDLEETGQSVSPVCREIIEDNDHVKKMVDYVVFLKDGINLEK